MDISSILTAPATWIIAGLYLLYALYRYGTQSFDYFSNQGISGPKPVPFFGNLWAIWKKNFIHHDVNLAKEYGKVFGFFEGTIPNLFISDAELIKNVFVKDFDHFINRRSVEVRSKYFRKMISLIRNDEWKEVRSSVSPTFTTGKIKRMSILIKRCADFLANKVATAARESGKINAKDVFSAFTMDVIAKCAFGLEIETLGKDDDPFMKNAKFIFNPPISKSPLFVIPFIFPKLMTLLGDRIFVTKQFMFFIDLLVSVIKERASSDKKYHDFIEVATEALSEATREMNGNQVQFTREEVDELIIAQSTLFLLAGFDTTATTLTIATYLLAKNPHVQQKLYKEIMNKVEQCGDVSHEMILDFPYVDQVVHEVLRMYSPAPRLERECNKDVTYNGIVIKKGVLVSVPVYAVHYSEEYYTDAEKFDPDRWAPENRPNLNPNAFLPFGMGPRNCVGMRFAMEELKIALCTIVMKLRFYPVEETPEKLEFEDGLLTIIQPIKPIVGVELRT
nr:CYP360A4 protein [Diaphanosoma celebensis]